MLQERCRKSLFQYPSMMASSDLEYVGAALAGFTLYIFSIYSAIYGIILFNEPILSFHYYGATLVFIGVYLARKIVV